MSVRYLVGDARGLLRDLPDGSVDLVLSSPPFLALRSYLASDHPSKAQEIGSEPAPGEFIDVLLDVVEECRRVLAPHGSLVLEMGDTYAGSGGGGGDYLPGGLREGQPGFTGSGRKATEQEIRDANAAHWRQKNGRERFDGRESKEYGTGSQPRPPHAGRARAALVGGGEHTRREVPGWPLDKSLCMVPELLRFSLAYGFNPLTGRETERWRIRNVIRWVRPNPPVGALADKCRPATSDLLVACVGRQRYWDMDAVRTAHKADPSAYSGNGYSKGMPAGIVGQESMPGNPAGVPLLDWWEIPTQPYPGRHYATWPQRLAQRPIALMCPPRVCTVCGRPSERLTKVSHQANRTTNGPQSMERRWLEGGSAGFPVRADRFMETLGWSDCGCSGGDERWRRGLVLDPFAGSGTTLSVAEGMGRDSIGFDLDERNLDLARERCGMFLDEPESA